MHASTIENQSINQSIVLITYKCLHIQQHCNKETTACIEPIAKEPIKKRLKTVALSKGILGAVLIVNAIRFHISKQQNVAKQVVGIHSFMLVTLSINVHRLYC